MIPKCPFFQKPCVKEDCSAYEFWETFLDEEGNFTREKGKYKETHRCHALNIHLPVRKNKELPPTPDTRAKFTA